MQETSLTGATLVLAGLIILMNVITINPINISILGTVIPSYIIQWIGLILISLGLVTIVLGSLTISVRAGRK